MDIDAATRQSFGRRSPCVNCPFRSDETRIEFANLSRAMEIEEQAYRRGFPCHESAEVSDLLDEYGEPMECYVFGEKTQHCAGFTIMNLKQLDSPWPGIGNDEDVVSWLYDWMDFDAPVFDSTQDFFEANTPKEGS